MTRYEFFSYVRNLSSLRLLVKLLIFLLNPKRTNMKNSDISTLRSFIQLRERLTEGFSKKMAEAEKQDKKLLILYGENHEDFSALPVKIIIQQAAAKIGIENLIVEAAPADKPYYDAADLSNHHQHILDYHFSVKCLKMKPTFSDLEVDLTPKNIQMLLSPEGIKKRESNMGDVIKTLNSHAVMGCGDLHIGGLLESEKLKGFDIVPITINYSPSLDLQGHYLTLERERFLMTDKRLNYFNSPDTGERSSLELMATAIGKGGTNRFINALKESGNLEPGYKSPFVLGM